MKNCLTFLFAGAMLLASCNLAKKKIRGNGTIQTETRSEKGFQTVDVQGAIKLYVRQDSSYSLKVETDANLMEYVETFMEKNTLVIRPKRGVRLKPSNAVKVYISSPSYRFFDVSGASELIGEGRISSPDELFLDLSGASTARLDIKSPKTGIDLSGACTAKISGETRDLDIEASGASNAYCYMLQSENAAVDISGASTAEVFASQKLNASAAGASNIRYKGNPAVQQSASGASGVTKE